PSRRSPTASLATAGAVARAGFSPSSRATRDFRASAHGAERKSAALEILRAAGYALPRLNVRIAGEEADLSWAPNVLIEVDGGPFHLDVGNDARKQACWERAGWTVRRISSDYVY